MSTYLFVSTDKPIEEKEFQPYLELSFLPHPTSDHFYIDKMPNYFNDKIEGMFDNYYFLESMIQTFIAPSKDSAIGDGGDDWSALSQEEKAKMIEQSNINHNMVCNWFRAWLGQLLSKGYKIIIAYADIHEPENKLYKEVQEISLDRISNGGCLEYMVGYRVVS